MLQTEAGDTGQGCHDVETWQQWATTSFLHIFIYFLFVLSFPLLVLFLLVVVLFFEMGISMLPKLDLNF